MKEEDIRLNKDIQISSTKIRKDVEKNKEYLENNIYKEFKQYK